MKMKKLSKNNEEEDLRFDNPESAFRSKTFGELIRGYIVFLMCTSKFLVTNSEKLMKLGEKILGNKLFSLIMRMTVFGHFVGGEDKKDLLPKISLLRKYGVKSVLDYAVEDDISSEEATEKEMEATTSAAKTCELEEFGGKLEQYKPSSKFADRRQNVTSARSYFYENEEKCERNADNVIECIRTSAELGHKKDINFIALKFTALGRPQLLLLLSEVIVRTRTFATQITGQNGNVLSQKLSMEQLVKNLQKAGIDNAENFLKDVVRDKEGVIHLFPWSGIINDKREINESFKIPSLSKKQMVPLISELPDEEKEMFINTISRLKRILSVAEELNTYIMVDAEHTYFQPAISRITMELMQQYNKKRCVLLNTYQSYLKQAYDEYSSDLRQAERQNFFFGFKLVRGAYLVQERERAKELGYPDPTNESYDKTTEMFNKISDHFLNKIVINHEKNIKDRLLYFVASHNEDSVKSIIEQMECYNIKRDEKAISFGQLLGMCDFMTFPLGQAGYAAYKYVPYGPINKVLPYLVRRAQENSSVLQKLKKEKSMLAKEIIRRILRGKFFYKP